MQFSNSCIPVHRSLDLVSPVPCLAEVDSGAEPYQEQLAADGNQLLPVPRLYKGARKAESSMRVLRVHLSFYFACFQVCSKSLLEAVRADDLWTNERAQPI